MLLQKEYILLVKCIIWINLVSSLILLFLFMGGKYLADKPQQTYNFLRQLGHPKKAGLDCPSVSSRLFFPLLLQLFVVLLMRSYYNEFGTTDKIQSFDIFMWVSVGMLAFFVLLQFFLQTTNGNIKNIIFGLFWVYNIVITSVFYSELIRKHEGSI